MTQENLRDWKERNQGQFPKSDPTSKVLSHDSDIAKPGESDAPNGDVTGEPGASGANGGGVRGAGSLGGTSSPNAATSR